jgi:DDE family transposase
MLLDDLQRLLEPATEGDPVRPLMWVSKSHAKLAAALREMGHQISASRILKLLERLHHRRQVNRKTKEGSRHPDRDAQFEHINKQVIALQTAGQPVISVDTKKKELIGAPPMVSLLSRRYRDPPLLSYFCEDAIATHQAREIGN